MKSEKLQIQRHSAAHVLAAAVLQMFPETKFGTGPATDSGFYYDFLLPRPLIPEDLPILENKMREISAQKILFEKSEMEISAAEKFFENLGQNFKIELLQKLRAKNETAASIFQNGDFIDLCAGPHAENTGEIGAFKLTNFAGSYWQGNSENPQLTRIYGLCFANEKDLRKYEKMLAEAKKRDHREIGKKWIYFHFTKRARDFRFGTKME
jgi:Threonyl-tRNA synthetase